MKLRLTNYEKQQKNWPQAGYHLMAQYDDTEIIVYQAYNSPIGHFASKNQYFGGPFSLDRMSWIKPNFLWMMYRNSWGTKENQKITLAIHLKLEAFVRYINQGVYSSLAESAYTNETEWKTALTASNCRLQWDPDHDPFGSKLERRAIQIGLRNDLIKSFATEDILEIEDISDFVSEQQELVNTRQLDQLVTPDEKPLVFKQTHLNKHLKLNHNES